MIPRLRNPDPRGYIMAQAEARVEAEADGQLSVAQLLDEVSKPSPQIVDQKPSEDTKPTEPQQKPS
jgi:hypothetical protein